MFFTIYSGGSSITTGDYRAKFLFKGAGSPPAFNSTGIEGTIGGKSITLHDSSFDSVSREYSFDISLQENPLDLLEFAGGLVLLLSLTTEDVQLLSISKNIEISVEIIAVVLLLGVAIWKLVLKK